MDQSQLDEVFDRCIESLNLAIASSGQSQAQIERDMGWSARYLTRILTGRIELKVEHIALIMGSCDLTFADFCRAYLASENRDEGQSAAAIALEVASILRSRRSA